jgi:hypothetical protein
MGVKKIQVQKAIPESIDGAWVAGKSWGWRILSPLLHCTAPF